VKAECALDGSEMVESDELGTATAAGLLNCRPEIPGGMTSSAPRPWLGLVTRMHKSSISPLVPLYLQQPPKAHIDTRSFARIVDPRSSLTV